jgi:hypothetical protein
LATRARVGRRSKNETLAARVEAMFGELPKLLDRNFAIGFYLPAAVLVGLIAFVLDVFRVVSIPAKAGELHALVATTIAIVIVWLAAIALLALNYPILRLLEGYGRVLRRKPLSRLERRSFLRTALPAIRLQRRIEAARREGRQEPPMPPGHPKRLRLAVEDFPADSAWILPTRFGNRFSAIDDYPRIVYGIDPIPFWPRLQAVMPEPFRQQLAGAKAQLDFCVNLTVIGWAAAVLPLLLALYTRSFPFVWFPLGGAAVGVVGYMLALSAVGQLGHYMKSAFDLYRGELAKQLGLDLPRSLEHERAMWETASRMMIYRSRQRAEQLVRFRQRSGTDAV